MENHTRRKWSYNEVSGILSSYHKKVPIKTLAHQYKTTPNAIQKVLQKYKHPHVLETLRKVQRKRGDLASSWRVVTCQPEWVEWDEVVAWLEQQDMAIIKTTNPALSKLFPFQLQERYMSQTQVLFEANRHRLRQGRAVFWVKDLSREEG